MKNYVYVAIVALISGCATAPLENTDAIMATAVPPSRAIKTLIVNEARNVMLDPYSVRDAEISYVGTFSDGVQGLCVKANAKNAMGGYTGRDTLGLSIKGGRIISSTKDNPLCFDPKLKWIPFPELEAL